MSARQTHTPESRADSGEMISSQAAFQTDVQSGRMNCALLAWVADQDHLSIHLLGFLLKLVKMSDGERIALSQKAIGERAGLKERQTRALVKALVDAGVLARRARRGGAGSGRSADVLVFNRQPDATGEISPEATQAAENHRGEKLPPGSEQQPAMGNSPPETGRNDEATGNEVKVAPHIRNAGKRARHPVNNTISETNTSLERGLGRGDLFAAGEDPPADAAPPAKTRRKRTPRRDQPESFIATEATMPSEPPEACAKLATAAKLINGTRQFEWTAFRSWHIEQRSEIKSLQGRWGTWVRNWAAKNPNGSGPKGYKPIGYGEDGEMRYEPIRTYYR